MISSVEYSATKSFQLKEMNNNDNDNINHIGSTQDGHEGSAELQKHCKPINLVWRKMLTKIKEVFVYKTYYSSILFV